MTPRVFSISDQVDYIQQMLFNYTYYFYQTRFSTGLSILATRHHFVVAPMNLLWYRRLKRYYIDQWEIYPSAFYKLIWGMITLQCCTVDTWLLFSTYYVFNLVVIWQIEAGFQAVLTAFSMALPLTFLSCLKIAAYTKCGVWSGKQHTDGVW